MKYEDVLVLKKSAKLGHWTKITNLILLLSKWLLPHSGGQSKTKLMACMHHIT